VPALQTCPPTRGLPCGRTPKAVCPTAAATTAGGSLVVWGPVLTSAGCAVEVGDLRRTGGAHLFAGAAATVAAVDVHPDWGAAAGGYDGAVRTIADPPSAASATALGVVYRPHEWVGVVRGRRQRAARRLVHCPALAPPRLTGPPLGSPPPPRGPPPRSPCGQRAGTGQTGCRSASCPRRRSAPVSARRRRRGRGASARWAWPLFSVCSWPGQTVYQMLGVASYWLRVEGGGACPTGLPTVYTRVEAVRGWVWSAMYVSY